MDFSKVVTVGIVGAGVAGLATARLLIKQGLSCTLFERNSKLGGVWSDGYLNFGVQVQRELYEFPDWPLPPDTPDFTPGPMIEKYLKDFADQFGVTPHIRFDSKVIDIAERDGPGSGWTITVENQGQTHEHEFDLVVICIGLYSNIPNMPEFPGQSDFKGEVIHNSKLKSSEQLENKKVAVVGFGKSATDAALESAKSADQAHIIFREPHWPIPQKLAGILPFKWGLLHRMNSTLIPPYQYMTTVEKWVHGPGKPMVWLYWRLVEALLFFQCRLGSRFGTRTSFVPEKPIEIDAFGESTMLPRNEFYRAVRRGEIEAHRVGIERYTASGVKLTNGTELDLDLLILATGWECDFTFLSKVWDRLNCGEDGFYLYRHMLNPDIPGLVFIGRASSISSILTYCIQARWLADVLSGRVQLPSYESMKTNIAEMKAWKQWMPFSPARSARLIAHTQHYHDELLRDLGISPLRKQGVLAPLKELIVPYQPSDYASVTYPTDQSL